MDLKKTWEKRKSEVLSLGIGIMGALLGFAYQAPVYIVFGLFTAIFAFFVMKELQLTEERILGKLEGTQGVEILQGEEQICETALEMIRQAKTVYVLGTMGQKKLQSEFERAVKELIRSELIEVRWSYQVSELTYGKAVKDLELLSELKSAAPQREVAVRFYAVQDFFPVFILVVEKRETSGLQALFGFPSLDLTSIDFGIFCRGGEAIQGIRELVRSTSIRKVEESIGGQWISMVPAILLNDETILTRLLQTHHDYLDVLGELSERRITLAGDEVYLELIRLSKEAKNSIRAIGLDIMLDMQSNPLLREYVEENRKAAERGVGVTRIFLLKKQEFEACYAEMIDQYCTPNFEARIAFLEETPPELHEYFSIFDDSIVVYLSAPRTKMERRIELSKMSSRYVDVQKYIRIYKRLYQKSKSPEGKKRELASRG